MAGLADNVTILMPKKKVGSQAASAEKKKLRVAAYARVSTDNEEQEGSYEIQVEYYTALIKNNPDWEFAGVYADDGISGTYTAKRGGFMQMIEDCRARKIDMILTKSISRFARNTVDCLNFTRELKELNIAVRFEKENINTLDASGEVLLTIMAALAQQESESLSQNVRIGIKFRNEQGKVQVNYNRFLGYTKDEDGHLIIDEAQAVIVRRIYDDFLSGMSPRQIKERLEADGILNGAGNPRWQVSNIHQILTNEKYIGDALLQKTWTYNTLEKKRRKNRTDAPKYYVVGNHEPIISKETFAAVQRELVRRADMVANGRKKRVYSGKYPFSGLLFCGNCGDIFSRVVWNVHGRKQVVWRCFTRMQDGTEACHCRTIDEEMLQRITVNAINRAYRISADAVDRVAECVDEALNESLLEQAAAIDEKIKALQIELIGYRADSPDADRIGGEILTLRDEKASILSQSALQAQRTNETKILASFCEGLSGLLITFDESYVRRLFSRITIYEDKVILSFKDGKEVTIKE